MPFLVRFLPARISRLMRMPPDTVRNPSRSTLLFMTARVDTSLPRSLRRDGWWLET